MKRQNDVKPDPEAGGLWQKTKYANLVRNVSSGKYFVRFRNNGKLIWRGLKTDVLSTAAQRLPDKIKEITQSNGRRIVRENSRAKIGRSGVTRPHEEECLNDSPP